MTGMSAPISQRELRNDSGEIMRRVHAGESFVVTSHGSPIAELVPLHRSRYVSRASVLALFANAPGLDAEQFRADVDPFADQTVESHG